MSFFFFPKTDFLGLPPVSPGTTAVSETYYWVRLKTLRRVPRNTFFIKSQKVVACGYYGIENPLQDLLLKTPANFIQNLNANCQLVGRFLSIWVLVIKSHLYY